MAGKFSKYFAVATVLIMMLQIMYPGVNGVVDAAEVTEISTVEDFDNIRNDLAGDFKLVNDIDFEGGDPDVIEDFSGTIDGQGYALKNIYFNKDGEGETKGFFSLITENPVFKNLKIENVTMNIENNRREENYGNDIGFGLIATGVMAHQIDTPVFENIHFKDIEVVNNGYSDIEDIGLLADSSEMGSTMRYETNNIFVDGFKVTANKSENKISNLGALYGEYSVENYFSNPLKNAYVKNLDYDIENSGVPQNFGGIIGSEGNGGGGYIENVYAHGSIKGKGDDMEFLSAGGIVGGQTSQMKITDSYSEVNIDMPQKYNSYAGGIIGMSIDPYASPENAGMIAVINSYAAGHIKGGTVGGISAYSVGYYEDNFGDLYYGSEFRGNLVAVNELDGNLRVGELSNYMSQDKDSMSVEVKDYKEYATGGPYTSPYYENMKRQGIDFTSISPSGEDLYEVNEYTDDELKTEYMYTKNEWGWDFRPSWKIDEGVTLPYQTFNGADMKENTSGIADTYVPSPSNFTAKVVSGEEISLNWDDVAGSNGYTLERDGVVVYEGVDTSFNDKGLSAETGYTYDVYAENESVVSRSSKVSTSTLKDVPLNLTYSNVKEEEVKLQWDSADGADIYVLRRDGTKVYEGVETEYVDSGLVKGNSYNYEITAVFNGEETSPYGLSVTTLEDMPDNPKEFSVSDMSSEFVELSWGKVENVSDYEVYKDGTLVYSGSNNSYKDTDVEVDKEYTYELVSKNEFGENPDVLELKVTVGYEDGYEDGYDDGYGDGSSDGSSDGYDEGYDEGYEDGSSDGYNDGYGDGSAAGSSDGYNEGYNDGSSDGYDEGSSDGYDEGYEEGSSDGYNEGYQEGLEDGKEEQKNTSSSCDVAFGETDVKTVSIKKQMMEYVSTLTLGSEDYKKLGGEIEDGNVTIGVECESGAGRHVVTLNDDLVNKLGEDNEDLDVRVEYNSEDSSDRFYYEFNVDNVIESSELGEDFTLDIVVDKEIANEYIFDNTKSDIYDISFVERNEDVAKEIEELERFVKFGIVNPESGGNVIPVRLDSEGDFTYLPSIKDSFVHEIKFNRTGRMMLVDREVGFEDVKRSFAKDEIEKLASRQVIYGKTDKLFDPGDNLTRIQLISLLSRLVDKEGRELENSYADVPDEGYKYRDSLSKGEQLGIVLNENKLNAYEEVDREEFSIMVHNFVGNFEVRDVTGNKKAKDMKDYPQLSDESKKVFDKLFNLGIVQGSADGEINFDGKIRRDEATAMIYRAYEAVGMVGER